ncbi:MAG: cyanophycinase [Planctomycetes bacterium]|nr:cyanophycinase [Planctomycetota bacterium]
MQRLRYQIDQLLKAQVRVSTLLYTGAIVGLVALAMWLAPERGDAPQLAPGQEAGGTLVICGGGDVPREVEQRFVRLAGGREARLVIIPTAHYEADDIDPLDPHIVSGIQDWKKLGVAEVMFLHTRSREVADDDDFLEPLRNATGVWIEGGDQEWLTQPYANTKFEEELHELLDRGGAIGGNSAGAACMTRVMIASGRHNPREGEGFDLLPGAVVDQHFLKRNRPDRLKKFMAAHGDLIGFGIDERTALVVRVRDQRLTVVGDSYVMAYVPDRAGQLSRLEVLQPGDVTDMTALREQENPVASFVEVDENFKPESVN